MFKHKFYQNALVLVALVAIPAASFARDLGSKSVSMWKTAEWSVSNVNYSGNPYDVVAKVTYRTSGETRTTEMFYDGNNTFKFRFLGSKPGRWTFTTSSSNSALNGHTGSVNVSNSNNMGLLTTSGNKFARYYGTSKKVLNYNIYMDHKLTGTKNGAYVRSIGDSGKVSRYIADAKKHGMNGLFIGVNNNWFQLGRDDNGHGKSNPDRETFKLLEKGIQQIANGGLNLHMWAWGDKARLWVPKTINGTDDKRLQRYIAARLGPIAGWTMGYGFDLNEWVGDREVGEWSKYMRDKMGWDHLLWARGLRSGNMQVTSYTGICNTYSKAQSNMRSNKPQIFSERDFLERDCGDEYTARRSASDDGGVQRESGSKESITEAKMLDLMWSNAMAGGHANIYGYFVSKNRRIGNLTPFSTYGAFWDVGRGRMTTGMRSDDGVGSGKCIRDGGKAICYVKGASSATINASGPVIAVDAMAGYKELSFGSRSGRTSINLPKRSNWIIVTGIGSKGAQPAPSPSKPVTSTPTPAPSTPAPNTPKPNTPAPSNPAPSAPAPSGGSAGNLPLKMTSNKTANLSVTLNSNPGRTVNIIMNVFDGDLNDEGRLYVNDRFAYTLFQGKKTRDNGTAEISIPTNGSLWKRGSNKLTFKNNNNRGYDIRSLRVSTNGGTVSNPTTPSTPSVPPASNPGNGSTDKLELSMRGKSYNGDAAYEVLSNDTVIKKGTVSQNGTRVTVDVPKLTSITVRYTNDLYGGSSSKDRNLYITGAKINGKSVNLRSAVVTGCRYNKPGTTVSLNCEGKAILPR